MPVNRVTSENIKTRFQPGVSGNPNGRPKNEFGVWIRNNTDEGKELAKKVLWLFRKTKNPKMILECATWLSDHGWGKVPQAVDLGGDMMEQLLAEVRNRYT